MGIKIILCKVNYLCIVILWFDYLTPYKVILKPIEEALEQHHSFVAVSYNDTTWMVLLENAGSHSPE